MRPVMPLILLLLSGCDLSMTRQDRHEAQSSPTLWPGGPMATPADGAVAQDQPARDAALADPPPVTLALLQRGRERYAIYCTPCHGSDGAGRGPIVQRGFPQPAAFSANAAPARHTVDVITNGHGVMYGFADRIEPADRWAIAAYIEVLAHCTVQNLPQAGKDCAVPLPLAGGVRGGQRHRLSLWVNLPTPSPSRKREGSRQVRWVCSKGQDCRDADLPAPRAAPS